MVITFDYLTHLEKQTNIVCSCIVCSCLIIVLNNSSLLMHHIIIYDRDSQTGVPEALQSVCDLFLYFNVTAVKITA